MTTQTVSDFPPDLLRPHFVGRHTDRLGEAEIIPDDPGILRCSQSFQLPETFQRLLHMLQDAERFEAKCQGARIDLPVHASLFKENLQRYAMN